MTEQTTRSQIKSALRMLWLRSKERSHAMKLHDYTCQKCNAKQSKAKGREVKVEVHHVEGVGNWDKIIEVIREQLLCDPDLLEVLCEDCHKEETYGNDASSA